MVFPYNQDLLLCRTRLMDWGGQDLFGGGPVFCHCVNKAGRRYPHDRFEDDFHTEKQLAFKLLRWQESCIFLDFLSRSLYKEKFNIECELISYDSEERWIIKKR